MRTEVANDLTWSAMVFRDVVWPCVGPSVGGGEIVAVECVTMHDFKNELDTLAGIDAWQIQHNACYMRGVASRVQVIKGRSLPYDSFTIRLTRSSGAKTEYEKRLYQIDNSAAGYLYPYLTIQAYVTESHALLSAAAIRTADLYNYVRQGEAPLDYVQRINPIDGNEFICVFWDALKRHGIKLIETRTNDGNPLTSRPDVL